MSEQTLKRVFGALGILVVVWIGSVLLSGRGGGGPVTDSSVASVFEGLDETTVSGITITGPAQSVMLLPAGDAWTVNANLADSAAMARFWAGLQEADVGGVVANNPSNHERMGLSADSAWTVDFTLAEGGTRRILVGKTGPIFPSGYVRLPDQDAVVVVSGEFRTSVVQSITQWRDKTIVRVDTAAVARVVMETGEGTNVAERADTTWSVNGEPADASTMRLVLDELAHLVGLEYVEESEVSEENPRRVIALGADADTLGIVMITGGSPGNPHVRTPGSTEVLTVPIFRAGRLTPAIDALQAEAPGGA